MSKKLWKLRGGSPELRFWKMVNKTKTCWLWTGAIKTSGYGIFNRGRVGEGLVPAHRFSLELHGIEIPPKLLALHKCNNKLCVNPEHLYVGNHSQNLIDAYRDGISKTVKFKAHQVMQMRKDYDGTAAFVIKKAIEFSCCQETVRRMLRHETYKFIHSENQLRTE